MSPSRPARARPVQNASNAPLDKSSPKGHVSHPVIAPPDNELGFTLPRQRSSTALQPLGAPSADFKGADDAPRQAAARTSPGPLKAAVARLLKSGNKAHFIVFKNGELTLDANRPRGLGLGKPEQQKAFCNLFVAELAHMQPKEASSAELKAFQASAHRLANAFVNRALQQLGNDINGNNIQLGVLPNLLDQLSGMYGQPASELDAGTALLRQSPNSDLPARAAHAPESKTPGGMDPRAEEKSAALGLLTTGLFSGLLLQFGLVKPLVGAPSYPVGRPFTASDMNGLMDRMTAKVCVFDPQVARMFDAVHEDPSLSDHALRHANQIRQNLFSGHSRIDRLAGAGLPATALLLSLPPERLKQMFLTRAQVERLAEEAYVVLGHLPNFMDLGGTRDTIQPFFESISSPQPEVAPRMVSQTANAFIDTAGGGKIAYRFTSAIQILLHNAERLEAFADLDDALDGQLEYESASISELLQEYVPADFENAPRIDLHAEPKTAMRALALVEEPSLAEPGQAMRPLVVHAAQAEVQPVRVVSKPRATRSPSDAGANPVTNPGAHPKLPGSKRRNPAEHFHPRDHHALSRNQLKQRKEVLQARELDLIGAYDKWTPELRSLLKERSRARRDISSGGRLVPPPELHR